MPSLETRRAGFETLFDALEEAGIVGDSLQQAWWFHTASDESTRATLKTMRWTPWHSSARTASAAR